MYTQKSELHGSSLFSFKSSQRGSFMGLQAALHGPQARFIGLLPNFMEDAQHPHFRMAIPTIRSFQMGSNTSAGSQYWWTLPVL